MRRKHGRKNTYKRGVFLLAFLMMEQPILRTFLG